MHESYAIKFPPFNWAFYTENVEPEPLAVRRVSNRFSIFLGAFAKLRMALSCLSVGLPVCPSDRSFAWNNSAPTGRIFMKFGIREFFENLSTQFKFH